MAVLKEVMLWPFKKGLFWGYFHSREVPCACITLMCTCLLTHPAQVTQAR